MSDQHDFDAWRAAQRAKRRPEKVTIFGATVAVPSAISVDLSMRIAEAELDDVEAITELVGELYGEGELTRWREAGCTVEEFALLLAWGASRAQGEEVTFEEAAESVARQRAALADTDAEGKAGNRAQRRAARKSRR